LATVERWAAEYPSGNIGIATGAASGFVALDVDVDKGGAESLAALVTEHGPLPATVQAQTGSGGAHYLFKLPEGVTVRNSASRIAPGLDIRGDGGQIVVAPSVSLKGSYRWVRGPTKHPIADAPDWLIEAPRPRAGAPTAPPERGFFPPAGEDVIQAALEALNAHGPAVEGNGGDDHTFRACALLAHDFALTFEEAWPLLWRWNETCEPPWGETALADKLRGGDEYGTGQYGSRRRMGSDLLPRVRAMIKSWRDTGAKAEAVETLGKEIRGMVDGADPIVIDQVNADWRAETGLSVRALALGRGTVAGNDAAPEDAIEVTVEVHDVADRATKAIAPDVFQRHGQLCEVAAYEKTTMIVDLKAARIQDLMSRHAKFVRKDEKGTVSVAAPLPIAQIIHDRRKHTNVREIDSVTTSPIFLEDGSILQERGYNAKARVFLEPSVTVQVPDEPTRDDARAAVREFYALLSDFRFAERADFSSWLATLLTALVKAAIGNAPAPMLCISAASPGAGKTLLAEVAALILTGQPLEAGSYSRDPIEFAKRVTALVLGASPIGVFDDLNGRFGPDEVLDRLLTSSVWKTRLLGGNDVPPLPNVTTWIATGNNIEPCGATVRRIMMCRIDVLDENPQERGGFRIADLRAHVITHRAELLRHALTILRAYHLADRPAQSLPSWGSFEKWSALVRGALVWCGLPDPYVTQRRALATMNDAERDAHDFWLSVIEGATDGVPASIALAANARDARGVLGAREEFHAHSVGVWVQRFIDRPRHGKRIRRTGSNDGPRYHVERI
jgi:hypothetical protein